MFARFRRSPASPDPAVATEDDIRMCFRLLLGREPKPEEWPGHAAQAGQLLSRVVAGYVGSLEFARRGLLGPDPARRIDIVELDGFRLFASPDDPLIGREILLGFYEPDVAAVVRTVARAGMAVVDLGANVGFFTMLAASLVGPAGAVLAVEPHGDNVRMIEASRRLNGFANVTVAAVAAGRGTGLLQLNTTHSNGITSSLPEDADALQSARIVPVMAVDVLVASAWGQRRIGLIKADVEGAEHLAMQGAAGVIARDRPLIVTEFSPEALESISGISGPDYLRFLCAQGYTLSVIEPGGVLVDVGQEVDPVMATYARRVVDHIDLLARPLPS